MATATHTRRPRLSRGDLGRLIAQYARLFGWRHHHVLVAGRLEAGYPHGFPSEVLVRADRLMFVTPVHRNRQLLDEQRAWLEALGDVSRVEVLVVDPDDLDELTSRLQQAAGQERPER
jgi:hypothetical protein